MADDWITTKQAAELSGYHPVTLRKLLLSGSIKGRKWGTLWQVSRADLLAYIRKVQELGQRRGPKHKT